MEASTKYAEVRLYHRPYTIEYPDGRELEMGVIKAIDIGRGILGRRKIRSGSIRHCDQSEVALPERAAYRLGNIFEGIYKNTSGEQLRDSKKTVIDCHSFMSHLFGLNSPLDPSRRTVFNLQTTNRSYNPLELQVGSAYGIYRDPIDPRWANQHSMLAVDDGDKSLSVLGNNGYFAVARNDDLMNYHHGDYILQILPTNTVAA